MKTAKKVILAVVLMMVTVGLCACGKTKIDLKDYVSIEASGADGYGELTMTVDYIKLGEALGLDEEIKNLKDADELSEVQDTLEKGDVLYEIKCSADKTEKLKNDDKIKISFGDCENVEEKLKAAFSNKEFTYTVSGLQPPKEIDPFEGVSVERSNWSTEVQSPEEYFGEYGNYYYITEVLEEQNNITLEAERGMIFPRFLLGQS